MTAAPATEDDPIPATEDDPIPATEDDPDSSDDLLARIDPTDADHERVTVSCSYRCHSGETFGGEWRGVPVGDLLADADPETTHVRAVSSDGYCVPVPIVDAFETVVAAERVDDGADSNGLPRLVGSGIEGPRTVRDLVRLEAVSLPADADAEPRFLGESDADHDGTAERGDVDDPTEVSD
ncbi:pterin operon protein [Halorubrum sp. DTA98]|uniref:pterin operon protein n=1 Tax=Halorubrum sp. DTA98 TaxID=3402163 RepID=UPI003AAE13CF